MRVSTTRKDGGCRGSLFYPTRTCSNSSPRGDLTGVHASDPRESARTTDPHGQLCEGTSARRCCSPARSPRRRARRRRRSHNSWRAPSAASSATAPSPTSASSRIPFSSTFSQPGRKVDRRVPEFCKHQIPARLLECRTIDTNFRFIYSPAGRP